MNVLDGFQATMQAIERLQAAGVGVKKKASGSRNVKETVDRYGQMPGRIVPSSWWHITLAPPTAELGAAIRSELTDLRRQGVSFDTGIGADGVDWEIDWSFCVRFSDHGTQGVQNGYF